MLTEQNYELIKPYRDIILSGAIKGETATKVCDIYDSISNRAPVQRYCGACLTEMLNYLKAHILTYESKQASEKIELQKLEAAASKVIVKQKPKRKR